MIRIPFSLLPPKTLERASKVFMSISQKFAPGFEALDLKLRQAEANVKPATYISMCMMASVLFLFFSLALLSFIFFILGIKNFIIFSILVAIGITIFVFIEQISYPSLLVNRKIKEIDRNLLPAMQDMLIQLNSGIPLFDIFVNISTSDYGRISTEFNRVVKEISSGRPQAEVLEDLALKNPSIFFRRAVWQMSNGLKAGSDLSIVLREIINALSQEQLIQIQNYGGSLNPLAMFYMLTAIIIPALAVTFITVISTFISSSAFMTKLVFWALFGMVIFFQIMFLGMIKTRRPNLL